MADRCPGCPVPPGLECEATRTGHRRYCELVAAGRTDYAALLVARATGTAPAPAAVTLDPAAEARARRAAKPRVALGTPQAPP
jgi:hypothetical protein